MRLAAFAFPYWRMLLEKRSRRRFKLRSNQEAWSARDGWSGYSSLPGHGYIHIPNFYKDAAIGDATPLAHRVATLLKRWWLGTHQGAIRPDHLAYYLDEFTFRFNRRTSRSRGKLFYRLIEGVCKATPYRPRP